MRLGIDYDHGYAFSRTRKGGWAVAQSPIPGTTRTTSRLKQLGYIAMLDLYLMGNPSTYEPSDMQTTRIIKLFGEGWERSSRTYGGVFIKRFFSAV